MILHQALQCGERDQKVITLVSNLNDKIQELKTELQIIVQLINKKQSMSKEVNYGQPSDLYETKSNNLTALRDEVMTALHSVVGKIDALHSLITTGTQIFTFKPHGINQKDVQLAIHMPSINP